MRQRGFTLLEMMLILLLIGVSAGMVMLAFPASRDDSSAQTLPQGLEVTLTLEQSGEIRRLFLLTPGGSQ